MCLTAAYLTLIQDKWKSKYPTIDGDTKIVATLYNNGLDNKVPHDNPQPSDFGRYAMKTGDGSVSYGNSSNTIQ